MKYPDIGPGVPLPRSCIDLLNRMLDKDPSTRITIENVLEHPYLQGSLAVLPKSISDSEDTKRDPNIKVTSALGKIIVRKFVDLKISKKDQELA